MSEGLETHQPENSREKLRSFFAAGVLAVGIAINMSPVFAKTVDQQPFQINQSVEKLSNSNTLYVKKEKNKVRDYTPNPRAERFIANNEDKSNIRLELSLSDRVLRVFNGDELTPLASYPVAIGRANTPTPTGHFEINSMVKNPGWQSFAQGQNIKVPPGTSTGPLGAAWLGFDSSERGDFGFHGTTNGELLDLPHEKRTGSAGCVRMKQGDVQQVYKLVGVGTSVFIKD
jgi:lipoprotein-anchoring transpeptidase ErfK/SrfK